MPPGSAGRCSTRSSSAPNVKPLLREVVGDIGKILWVLLGAVGIVLLVACANIANLFLVRAEGRQQELAVRSALGAGRGECSGAARGGFTLSLLGGLLGVGLAYGGIRACSRSTRRGFRVSTRSRSTRSVLLVARRRCSPACSSD